MSIAALSYTRPLIAAAGLLALPLFGAPASAQTVRNYCVTCAAPTSTHACTVNDEIGRSSDADWARFCAEQVAYDGGHGSCTAELGLRGCAADRQYSYSSTPSVENRSVEVTPPGSPGPRPGGTFEGAGNFVERVGHGTGNAVTGATDAVGNAAANTNTGVVGDAAGGVVKGAGEAVGGVAKGAGELGGGIVRGAGEVGKGVAKGVGCVLTLGNKC